MLPLLAAYTAGSLICAASAQCFSAVVFHVVSCHCPGSADETGLDGTIIRFRELICSSSKKAFQAVKGIPFFFSLSLPLAVLSIFLCPWNTASVLSCRTFQIDLGLNNLSRIHEFALSNPLVWAFITFNKPRRSCHYASTSSSRSKLLFKGCKLEMWFKYCLKWIAHIHLSPPVPGSVMRWKPRMSADDHCNFLRPESETLIAASRRFSPDLSVSHGKQNCQ